jgi:hypothetical protein
MGKLIDALKADHTGSVNKNGYFDSYKKNIFKGEMDPRFQEMFDEGSGGELHSKAEAVHSSSMLSYNFFHWINDSHPFEWDGVKYTQVFFEVKMKTIKGSQAPANMDVVLVGKDNNNERCLLFIESKFTEYLENKNKVISGSYKDGNRWYNKDINWKEIVEYVPDKKYKYKEGVKQLITHLFGIHSQFTEVICDTFTKIGIDYFKSVDLKFITLIFEPSKEKFMEEHEAFEDYKNLFVDFIGKIKKINGLKVLPEWVSYSEIWEEMKGQLPKGLEDYLWKRYMQFAQKND